jgi:hypothetical protein
VVPLSVFEHQPEAGDTVRGEVREVPVDRREVPAAEEAFELRPGDRVVLADRRPALAAFGLEIGRSGRHLDPWLRVSVLSFLHIGVAPARNPAREAAISKP